MEQIKDELGSNAVLLHTKKYREGGVLGGAEMIEVTAAVDESQQRTPQPSPAYVPPASPILPTNVVNRYRMNETAGPEGGAVPQVGPVYDVYAPMWCSCPMQRHPPHLRNRRYRRHRPIRRMAMCRRHRPLQPLRRRHPPMKHHRSPRPWQSLQQPRRLPLRQMRTARQSASACSRMSLRR